MIAYATVTGTVRNMERMAQCAWRCFITPATWAKSTGRQWWASMGYALDNGAWSAHTTGTEWDPAGFVSMVEAMGRRADWVALPDIVASSESLERSLSWIGRLRPYRLMLPVQDGMCPDEVWPLVHRYDLSGVFVGGSTEWKLDTLAEWAGTRGERLCHVARVNSVRRILRCVRAGATSIDGTSATRFSVNTLRLDAARRQGALGL